MRFEARVLAGLGALVAPFAAIYWFTSYEHAGSLMLAGFVVAFAFLAAYLLLLTREGASATGDEASAGEGEDLGFFPSRSVWPFVIGTASTLIAYGLAFSAWVALPGVALLAVAAAGYAAEAQRSR